MDDRLRTSWRIGIAVSLALLGTLALARPEPADDASTERTVATIKTVDPDDRELWVITGTGYSLRVMRFRVAADCRIALSGAPARLADLEPGQLCEVRHRRDERRRDEPYEAVSIEARHR